MPTLNVKKDVLFKALDRSFTIEELEDLCFNFGLEVDDVVVENDETVYKIDIPANRYDLLCVEGLATALLTFLEKHSAPIYRTITDEKNCVVIHNRPNTKIVRPIIVAAILRNVTLDKERYDSFIDLQDKLHHNICRKRTLVAIGTHDLDTIQPPIVYDAKPPSEIKFRALNEKEERTAVELMDLYSNHAQLKQYLPIIKDSSVYPVVLDSNNVVLSMPPIINGYHSRISVNTRNIFIECTATDITKAVIVLDTLVCAFSKYCKENFQIERCKVLSENGSEWYPRLSKRKENISVKKINKFLGLKLTETDIVKLLNRMSLKASLNVDKTVDVEIPPTRHDIIHACDIIEDVAIAVGYNNIPQILPDCNTLASQLPVNKLTEQLRHHIAYSGFAEALTFSLCSRADIGAKMKKDMNTLSAVLVSNPKTLEFQVVRTSLLPGLLKTISSNKHLPLPIKIFEVSDVVYKTEKSNVGAANERHICAVYYGKTSGFEVVHGLLNKIMQILVNDPGRKSIEYEIRAVNDSSYFPERCAEILHKGVKIGNFGILHPEVLSEFELSLPCSCLEFNIEPFV